MSVLNKALITISVLLLLGFVGCKSLINHIYNRTDCERFNIDNIEVRTGIDIPPVSEVICEFKESERTKVAVFTLERASLDLARYVKRNDFVDKGAFYLNTGEREDTKWNARLDKEHLELKVSLVYK